MRQGVAVGTKVGPIFRVRSGAALHGAVGGGSLLLAAGLIVVYILAPGVGDGLDLSRFHITAVEAGALLLALCIAGGFLGHFPLAVVMDDLRIFCAAAILAVSIFLAVLGGSSFLGHGIFQILMGLLVIAVHCFLFAAGLLTLALVLVGAWVLASGRDLVIGVAPVMAPSIARLPCSRHDLVSPGGFPVLGQFRQGSGLVLLCHLPVLRQFRQCSGFVSLGLGIDIGFVSLRVGFLLLGLGRRGLHLVGVRRQHGSRRGQGKTNGQHQSGRTSAQFVDFSHVPSSFNCCRVSGFACRP